MVPVKFKISGCTSVPKLPKVGIFRIKPIYCGFAGFKLLGRTYRSEHGVQL